MAKAKTSYACNQCGTTHFSWAGKCSVCNAWNSIEQVLDIKTATKSEIAIKSGQILKPSVVQSNDNLEIAKRIKCHIKDIDEVLGGGIVPGSVILIAGQPGIGKSTLMLQIANSTAKNAKTLYISGEESAGQVSMRANRLNAKAVNLQIVSSGSANNIATTIATGDYEVVIVDSIQTIATEEINGIPGSVSQVTNSAQLLTVAAKQSNTAVILVGHVTKEGSIAGPKVLEHLVDVVLQLEGDRYGGLRVLRGVKNRYGSTNEAAILDMDDSGLKIVDNPSAILLSERRLSDGSVVVAIMEGNRPLLVEVQALVNTTVYGYPKRAASGFDLNRLNLLVAMLERRTKLKLADKDIYINIVGGIKISENAADLAICMAIASASKGMQLSQDAVVFGEVGLSGEVRHVPNIQKRLAEANKMGFSMVIGPPLPNGVKASEYLVAKDIKSVLNNVLKKGSE